MLQYQLHILICIVSYPHRMIVVKTKLSQLAGFPLDPSGLLFGMGKQTKLKPTERIHYHVFSILIFALGYVSLRASAIEMLQEC